MKEVLIILLVWIAMIAISFWESRVEGKNAWDKGKLGWKWKVGNKVLLTSYHFWLFFIMAPTFLAIPLVLNYSKELLGILISAYFSGLVIEDFGWFVVNPVFPLKDFNPKKAKWHHWIKFSKKIAIPSTYFLGIIIAIASYFILWR
jgi:hypothetical protein